MNIKEFKKEIWWHLASCLEAESFEASLLDTDTSGWNTRTWEIHERRFDKARDEIFEQIMKKLGRRP